MPKSKPKPKPTAREPLTLYAIDKCFQHTSKLATPHRTPNFRIIYTLADPDTPITRAHMIALEAHNTGYDGLLERWRFFFLDRIGEEAQFEADLLPSLIHSQEE